MDRVVESCDTDADKSSQPHRRCETISDDRLSSKKLSNIAFQCGFASTSYFIARFKEKMGVTPREYKLR